LVYCFYDFDFQSVIQAFAAINFWYLIPLIFLEAFIALVRSTRLKYIIDPCKRIPIFQLFPIYCIGMMTNLLMPYLTGQVVRIYLLSQKEQLKKTFLFTAMVLEVIFDGLAIICIAIVISFFFVMPDEFKAWHFAILAILVLLAAVLLLWVSHLKTEETNFLSRWISRLPQKAAKKIEDVRASFFSGLEMLRSSKHFTLVSLLSILSWLSQAGLTFILIKAFRFDISLWGAVVITAVSTIFMTIVASPGNLGTFQAATVFAMKPFGIEKSHALAFSFMLHIAVYLPPILLGAFFAFKEGLSLKQLTIDSEKDAEGSLPVPGQSSN